MDNNAIPVSPKTTIIVKSSGDLFLRGVEQEEVRFQSSEDRIRIHQSNDTLYVETHASIDLEVPHMGIIVVEKVGGSAFIQDIGGSLVIQKIGGDLALQRLGSVRIDKIGGSGLFEGINETLTIGKVGGDLSVRQVAGRLEVETVGGSSDLQVMGLGEVNLRSGGDISLYITNAIEAPVTLRAGGDVSLYVPANISANFVLNSGGETINLALSDQNQPFIHEIDARRYEFHLGSGEVPVEVIAGGDVMVSDEEAEPESITSDLERRESAWMEARERRGNPSWSFGFGFDRSSAWADMVSRRAQEATRRAEQRSQAAMRKTEEQIRQAAERQIRLSVERPIRQAMQGFEAIPSVPTSAPSSEPVTEQERMLVLQMLQEKKISVEQADRLLAALEGRFRG